MNYEERLLKELPHITPADADAMARAAVYQGTLAKPPGSLGALENIYIRLCGISGKLRPAALSSSVRITAWWRRAYP